ncbi:MAG: hypothetical protein KKC76_19695, partial [Proteobacteria bacterium]|nr:hypothetical protein [Pseudomonadota bacterium]
PISVTTVVFSTPSTVGGRFALKMPHGFGSLMEFSGKGDTESLFLTPRQHTDHPEVMPKNPGGLPEFSDS